MTIYILLKAYLIKSAAKKMNMVSAAIISQSYS